MSTHGFISSFDAHRPRIADSAFVDISARIIGRVLIEENASVWPGAVLRADDEEIRIGKGSAVLDLCLLEAPHGHPIVVAPGALISHQACLHGAKVEAGTFWGTFVHDVLRAAKHVHERPLVQYVQHERPLVQ